MSIYPWNDIKILRSCILPNNRALFRPCNVVMKGLNIPLSWSKDMRFLCKKYRVSFVITDYDDMIPGALYYAEPVPTIQILKLKNVNKHWFLRSFFHELGHHLQTIVGERCNWNGRKSGPYRGLKENVKFERAAERVAYFIAKEYAPHMDFHHSEFSNYKKRKHIEDLAKWKGYRYNSLKVA